MTIKEKVLMTREQLVEKGPITIVAFGDSVTQGAFSSDEFDQEAVYCNVLRMKIVDLNSSIPVNLINAGIAGITAKNSVKRMEQHVLKYQPDLLIVCFGLNDVNGPLDEYLDSLKIIFEKSKEQNIDTIFMTPNMLNTYVADDTAEGLKEYAAVTAKVQTSGRMDEYMNAAVSLAKEIGITVCDCYSKWKELSKTQDTTMLLSNRINHPTKEMHRMFADCLFEVIFQ